MATICPYCAIEINESKIEAEDGCCPECGAVLAVRSAYDDDDEDAVYGDEMDGFGFDDDDEDAEDDGFSGDFDEDPLFDDDFNDLDGDEMDFDDDKY